MKFEAQKTIILALIVFLVHKKHIILESKKEKVMAVILYTLDGNGYIDFIEKTKKYPEGKFNMYVNLTNRCNCNCTFCLRHLKEDHKLWLKGGEPSVAEIEKAFWQIPMERVAQIVICGFGEPTMRLDDLLVILKFIRENFPQMSIRMNTNGLSDLEYGKKTARLFAGLLDTISISLNESTAQKYLDVTRSRFGIKSYEAMLQFACDCKAYIPNVVVTIVDIIGETEIAACKQVCERYGLNLRIRKYEKN